MTKLFRTAKITIAFFVLIAASYVAWYVNFRRSNIVFDHDTPTLICAALIAVAVTVLFTDWRSTTRHQ